MSTAEDLNGSTAFTAARTPLLVSNEERTEGELHEQTTTNDALRQTTLNWIKLLVILFDSVSLIIVFLTLAVQNQSPLFLNPTNTAVPWPNAVYIPWFIINVVCLGCGIVGAVRSKVSLVMVALALTAADFVLFMIIGRGKAVFLFYAVDAMIGHVAFLQYSKTNPPTSQADSTVLEVRRCNFYVQRTVVLVMASLNLIIELCWSWQIVHDSTSDYQGLPLASSVVVMWWILNVLSCISSIVGAVRCNCGLVVVGMIGCFVNIIFYLFRGNTSDGLPECNLSNQQLNFLLVFFFTLLDYNKSISSNTNEQHISTIPSQEVQAEV